MFLDILSLEKNSDGPRKQTLLWKRTLGRSMRLLKSPGDPLGLLGDPLGNPQVPPERYGRCIGTTKTAISQRISSARSSRLLRLNLPIRAHRMQHSTGPLSLQKGRHNQKGTPRSLDIPFARAPVPWGHVSSYI